MVKAASEKYQVDPKLVSAVAEVESGGNQGAESPAGAIGVMQLMPDTAASLGVNPYDKQQNIEGGARYLRQMLDSFGGDVKKAVAAYNAGPNAVKKYGGVPPYPETQNYVDKVLDLYR
jgi:soluble lytic murein transglycosylase-like protein